MRARALAQDRAIGGPTVCLSQPPPFVVLLRGCSTKVAGRGLDLLFLRQRGRPQVQGTMILQRTSRGEGPPVQNFETLDDAACPRI